MILCSLCLFPELNKKISKILISSSRAGRVHHAQVTWLSHRDTGSHGWWEMSLVWFSSHWSSSAFHFTCLPWIIFFTGLFSLQETSTVRKSWSTNFLFSSVLFISFSSTSCYFPCRQATNSHLQSSAQVVLRGKYSTGSWCSGHSSALSGAC